MGIGITNGPGRVGYYVRQAYDTAASAMDAVEHAPTLIPATPSRDGYMTKEYAAKLDGIETGVPIDGDSTVSFSLGCDANGVYMVIPDQV